MIAINWYSSSEYQLVFLLGIPTVFLLGIPTIGIPPRNTNTHRIHLIAINWYSSSVHRKTLHASNCLRKSFPITFTCTPIHTYTRARTHTHTHTHTCKHAQMHKCTSAYKSTGVPNGWKNARIHAFICIMHARTHACICHVTCLPEARPSFSRRHHDADGCVSL